MDELLGNETPHKSIEECMKRRPVTEKLSAWADHVNDFGFFLLIAILIYGIIISCTTANVEFEYRYSTYTEFDFGIFFGSLVPYCFYAIVEFCVYKFISVLLSALSGIYQHTAETAALKEYELLKKESENQ